MQECTGKEGWELFPPQLVPVPFLLLLPRPQVPGKPQCPLVLSQLVGSPACPAGSLGAGMLRTENGHGKQAFSTVEPTCAEGHSLHPSGC